jgi:hypothetical protein
VPVHSGRRGSAAGHRWRPELDMCVGQGHVAASGCCAEIPRIRFPGGRRRERLDRPPAADPSAPRTEDEVTRA